MIDVGLRRAVIPENLIRGRFVPRHRISASSDAILAILRLLITFAADLFRSRRHLEVENLFLRHQLNVAWGRAPHLGDGETVRPEPWLR
jgi:hypothetical protein